MEINLSGKRALVTGAAQGIGLATVKKLLACKAKVIALDVNEDKLKELSKSLPGVEVLVVDLKDWSATLKALKDIGRVQLVVNNAGVYFPGRIQEMIEEELDITLQVNLKAVMAVCQHVVKDLISAGESGAVVNIASVMATRPAPTRIAYEASKAAVVQFTRCLALECAPHGIRVNAVSPGMVRTEMARDDMNNPEKLAYLQALIPTKDKICEPEDIANAVAFLLCDEMARKITGVNLNVDSGLLLT